VVAVDPSAVTVEETLRRNRQAVDAGTVEVARTDATHLPVPTGGADGAIAVNSIQLWQPLDDSLAEVARVLRPGGRLVTLTHDWAIERSTGRAPDAWADWVSTLAAPVGLAEPRCWRAKAEKGRSVALVLTKAAS
jgi:SAM-dependent methyltransferase